MEPHASQQPCGTAPAAWNSLKGCPPEAMPVNMDVFRLILACLSRDALLVVTYISRLAREEASKELLKRPVRLLRIKQLQSFCEFALAGNLHNLAYVRKLTIEHIDQELTWKETDALLQILDHCTGLKELELYWCDVILAGDIRIRAAISALRTLTHLQVWTYRETDAMQENIVQIVTNTHSDIHTLRLSLVFDGQSGADLLQAIARACNRLEDTVVSVKSFVVPSIPLYNIRVLRLVFQESFPPLRDLYRTFPNVRELTIDSHIFVDAIHPTPNTLAARRNAAADYKRGEAWASLDVLRAFTTVIYALGLASPVRELNLSFYEVDLHDRMAETVSTLRPRMLTLSAHCAPDWVVPRAEPSVLLFQTGEAAATEGVRHLFLKMTYSITRLPNTTDVMNFLRPLLTGSRVELLHLAISEIFTSGDPVSPEEIVHPRIRLHANMPQSDVVPVLDLDSVAHALAECCASARVIAVTMIYSGHYVWSVERRNEQIVLTKLTAFEGQEAMEREAKHCLEG